MINSVLFFFAIQQPEIDFGAIDRLLHAQLRTSAPPDLEHLRSRPDIAAVERDAIWVYRDWGYAVADIRTKEIRYVSLSKESPRLDERLTEAACLEKARRLVSLSPYGGMKAESVKFVQKGNEDCLVFEFERIKGQYMFGRRGSVEVNYWTGDIRLFRLPVWPEVESLMAAQVTTEQALFAAKAFMAQIGNPHVFEMTRAIGPRYTDEFDPVLIIDKPGNENLVHGFTVEQKARARLHKAFLTYRIVLNIVGSPTRKCAVIIDAVSGRALYDEGSNFVTD